MRGFKKTKKKKYKCGDSISWDKSQTYGQKLKYLANFCKSFVKIYYIINSIVCQHLHVIL